MFPAIIAKSHLSKLLSSLVVLSLTIMGCGANISVPEEKEPSQAETASGEKPLVKVTVRQVNGGVNGANAPLYLALERGYYQEAGLDVELLGGEGSSTVIQAVGNSQDNFGFADLSTMAQFIAKGVPVKAVLGFNQRGAFGVISDKSLNITQPKDLEGHTMLYSVDSVEALLLPAFFDINGVDGSKVSMHNVNVTAKSQNYITKKTDMVGTNIANVFPLVNHQRSSDKMYFADFGLNLPSIGLFASTKNIEENPDVVRAFVNATIKGIQDAQAEPEAAAEALVKHVEAAKKDIILEQWMENQSLLQTERTKGQTIGWQSAEDWAEALQIMKNYMEFDGDLDPDVYFTNEFIDQ